MRQPAQARALTGAALLQGLRRAEPPWAPEPTWAWVPALPLRPERPEAECWN